MKNGVRKIGGGRRSIEGIPELSYPFERRIFRRSFGDDEEKVKKKGVESPSQESHNTRLF